MIGENGNELFWKEWQDILLAEFENRMAAVGLKGQGIAPASKTLTILFLQAKGFSVPAVDILPEAIRTIREKDAFHADISSFDKGHYDAIAMMGHHIGMVENSTALKQYLQDVRTVLKPEGQILLTAIDFHNVNEPEHRVNPTLSSKQFQQANLIGPFFHMWRIKADTLKSQAVAANWHCELIYRQDDSNYLARLNLAESK
jgi:SAM-dependent methyltransferase